MASVTREYLEDSKLYLALPDLRRRTPPSPLISVTISSHENITIRITEMKCLLDIKRIHTLLEGLALNNHFAAAFQPHESPTLLTHRIYAFYLH